jgi:transposase
LRHGRQPQKTAISIRRDGKRIWRGKCKSDPDSIATLIQKHAPCAERVIFETGPLSTWFYHALSAAGVPAICIDARHAKAALDMAANKTDANDADGLAHLAEVGFYREVRVKGYESMLTRTLVAARTRLVGICTELSNQIRGLRCPCRTRQVAKIVHLLVTASDSLPAARVMKRLGIPISNDRGLQQSKRNISALATQELIRR